MLFGALGVAVGLGLRRCQDIEVGACVTALVGFSVSALLAAGTGVGGDDLTLGKLWPLLLAGAIVPGFSQLLFVRAIRLAGASRTALLLGTSPLLSAVIAIAFLGEPFRVALLAGTVLIVLGGAALAWERTRPPGFRALGVVLALVCAALFATRDNVVRKAAVGLEPEPLAAASASLLAAAAVLVAYLAVTSRGRFAGRLRQGLPAFVPAGICLGLAYDSLVKAFDEVRVTIAAPLSATQSLWSVLLSAIVLRRTEVVGPRLIVAALLIVAGGATIGGFR